MAVTHEVPLTTPHLKAVTVGRSWAVTHAWPAVRKFIVTKPLGAAGGAIILLMVLTAIFADVLTPYDPYTVNQRVQFTAPSLSYWFGTDEFGRDVFTRIVTAHASRCSSVCSPPSSARPPGPSWAWSAPISVAGWTSTCSASSM